MLPVTNRLSHTRDIERVYRKGCSGRSNLFRIAWLPTQRSTARIAVVTSRKLSTKAVRRNLLKRQVRSILAELLPRLIAMDAVIQILPAIIQQASAKKRDEVRKAAQVLLKYKQLRADLVLLLERSRVLQ